MIQDWKQLGDPPGRALVDTRLQLHWAAQIPGAVGASWVAEMPEYGHYALEWLAGPRLLASQWTRTTPTFRVALSPEDLALSLIGEGGREAARFVLAGRTLAEGLEWVASAASELVGTPIDLPLTRPDHTMPTHAVGSGEPFSADRKADLAELARWYIDADRVLAQVRDSEGAPAAQTWPHHFDASISISIDPPEPARSIGVGMSPGDDSYAEPYWYVTPWPIPDGAELAPLDGGGAWHDAGWKGAVLTASSLADASTGDEQARRVADFVRSAIAAGLALLGPDR